MREINRRTTLLFPAVVGMSALPSRVNSQGLADATDLWGHAVEVFSAYQITTTEDFPAFFRSLWNTRLALSAAAVEQDVEAALNQILSEAQARLQEDKGQDFNTESGQEVKQNSIRFQNSTLALGTDEKTGEVVVQGGMLFAVRDLLCPLYPFC